jgi:hypothetical protein
VFKKPIDRVKKKSQFHHLFKMSTTKQLEASTQTVAGALTPHAPYSKDLEKQFVPCGIGSVRDRRDNVAEIENIVDWEDSEDLENPLNWPTKKKATAIGIVSLITMLSRVYSSSRRHD